MGKKNPIYLILGHIEEWLCEAILAFFVILMFVQIVLRGFWGYSLPWGEELSTYLFVWFAYLGASVAAKMSAHNRVTFQFMFFPPWVKTVSETIADLLWVAFNLYFVWMSYDVVFNRLNSFWKSQTLGVPMKYFYMMLPIAFALMSIRILWNIYLRLKGVEVIDPEQEELNLLKEESAKMHQKES